MLPVVRSVTPYNIDDQLVTAISRRDLSTVRYILESNRYRSTINQSLFFSIYRDDSNQPLTPLGIRLIIIKVFPCFTYFFQCNSSCCLSFWLI